MYTYFGILLNDGVSLFTVSLYRGTLVESFTHVNIIMKILQQNENKQQFPLKEVHNYRHTQTDV